MTSVLFTEHFSFISLKLPLKDYSHPTDLWVKVESCEIQTRCVVSITALKWSNFLPEKGRCCVSQVSRNYEVLWVVSSWTVCVSAATAPKQRAAYLASWPGWIRQKKCWDNSLVLSIVLLIQKTEVRARRRLRQLEALLHHKIVCTWEHYY